MTEWSLIFLGGLLGSSHCVGMCGGFALSVGMGASGWQNNLARQIVYSLGRLFTYTFIGTVVGFVGLRLSQQATIVNVQAVLSIVAGLLLVIQGLYSAGVLPAWRMRASSQSNCLARSFFGSFLTSPGWWNMFIAGLLTGFLPCGLVYAFLALAASSGDMLAGAMIMSLFGLGTIPIMVLTGTGATAFALTTRTRLLKIAAACVVITGIISMNRGLAYWQQAPTNSCPMCDNPLDVESK